MGRLSISGSDADSDSSSLSSFAVVALAGLLAGWADVGAVGLAVAGAAAGVEALAAGAAAGTGATPYFIRYGISCTSLWAAVATCASELVLRRCSRAVAASQSFAAR